MKKCKVIQWATGGIGKASIEGILDHPDLELVGCWVHSEKKAGLDVGEIVGNGRFTGIKATNSTDDILAMDADCVVYSPLFPNEDDVVRLLASGKNVVTPTGWFYPDERDTERLRAACSEGRSALHGTGIHPGGFSEKFPLMFSVLQRATSFVRVEEFSDIRTYGAPEVISELMGFGKTLDEVESGPIPDILAHGFYQSIHMLADELKMKIDTLETRAEFSLATRPIDSPIGVIPVGRVAAMRLTWVGLNKGNVVIEQIVNWFMGDEGFDKPWQFGPAGPRYEIELRGDPDLTVVLHGVHPHSIAEALKRNPGIVATALHCVNSVPYLCQQEPGIRTYLDLGLVAGRAAPGLLI